MTPWETILVALGGNAALLVVLGWLARSMLTQLFAKDLEKFKSDLSNVSTAAAERLKHELHLVAQEHQAVISQLHEKRAAVVAEAYGLLVEAQWAAHDFVSPAEFVGDAPKSEKYTTAMNAAAEFYRYFDKNRIYLPRELSDRIDEFVKGMRKTVIGFGIYVRLDEKQLAPAQLDLKYKAWDEAYQHFNTEVPSARAALESELRAIIGAGGTR